MNPFEALLERGQSIWLDYIRRGMTRSGELAKVIDEGVRGMTSNPAIFQKAIGGSDDYADVLDELVARQDLDAFAIYETLAIEDIREAATALTSVYETSSAEDGYVSLEVAPSLARDTDGTIEQARRLWKAVDRPNLMIKVPGTPEGLPAIEQLLAEGINVNVTLIFSRGAYSNVMEAFLRGAERFAQSGGDLSRIASVASFFVSRIDAETDKRLQAAIDATQDAGRQEALRALLGKAAVANAKLAYELFEQMKQTDRWRALADQGCRPQRLLWASTGTKNKAYSDVKYVEELVGPQTVNTVPPATLDAFLDHGRAEPQLTQDVEEARTQLEQLEALGVSLDDVTDHLLDKGVVLFEDAADGLLGTIAAKQRAQQGSRLDRLEATLPGPLGDAVGHAMAAWDAQDGTKRLFERDPALWTSSGEDSWLGWLDIVDHQRQQTEVFDELAQLVRDRGFTQVILLGMGGSSLAPDVFARVYGSADGSPKLSIVDSTDPAQILAAERSVTLESTLFIVSSKSGSTLEPKVLLAYFLDRMKTLRGAVAGEHFIAITDPGSALEQQASDAGFLRIFHGVPDIGGRFSAFSNFGIVPFAATGHSAKAFLLEAALMVGACGNASARENPGVELGIILGTAAKRGRDKLTIVASPAIAPVGAWLEQLVAESTGKHGKAIIPLEGEPLRSADTYGDDRLFVYLRSRATPHLGQDRALAALAAEGQPVVTLELDDHHALGQELFRWQVATAVAGALLEINPFDQPDVEASKVETRAVTEAYERDGSLPSQSPAWEGEGLSLYWEGDLAGVTAQSTLTEVLAAHLKRIGSGDYFAALAYLTMNEGNQQALHAIRTAVLDATGAATCVGFGPRFLHSTGQAYKGGPNSGVFLQITGDDATPLAIPDSRYDFSVVKAAQAQGDLTVLKQRERRALRVHLPADTADGLSQLASAIAAAAASL